MTEGTVCLLMTIVAAAFLHLLWNHVRLGRRVGAMALNVFIIGAAFGTMTAITTMTCAIERGNYCDRCR